MHKVTKSHTFSQAGSHESLYPYDILSVINTGNSKPQTMVRGLASIFLATRRHGPNVEYRPTAKEHRWRKMDTTMAVLKQRNLLALETFKMKSLKATKFIFRHILLFLMELK